MSRNVGVIGLGARGLGVARSLLRAEFRVHACALRSAVPQMFMTASGAGHGGEDDAAVIRISPGIDVPAAK